MGAALWAVLLLLMQSPRSPLVQWLLALAYVAVVATAPVLFVLWPLWLWRLLQTPSRSQRAWVGLIVAATIAIAGLTLTGAVSSGDVAPDLKLGLWDTLYGLAFRVFATPLLGYPLAAQLLRTWGWLPLLLFALAVSSLLLAFLAAVPLRGGKERVRLGGTIAAIGAATAALYAWRAHLYHYPFVTAAGSVELNTIRYFFLGIVAMFLLIFMAVDWAIATRRLQPGAAGAGVLVLVLLYSPTFSLPYWPDAGWPRYAQMLENRLDQGTAAWPAQYPQPAGWPPAEPEAYVHLLDASGSRLAGSDTLQEAAGDGSANGTIVQTSHLLVLLADLEPGSYDAAIGLYRMEGEQLLPGSAAILRGQLQVAATPD